MTQIKPRFIDEERNGHVLWDGYNLGPGPLPRPGDFITVDTVRYEVSRLVYPLATAQPWSGLVEVYLKRTTGQKLGDIAREVGKQ